MRKFVAGKLDGIHVTEANLNCDGSITLDPAHCDAAGILPMEFVEIWNKRSGERLSAYVILGERDSRCCVINGAAARTCQAGDQIIVCNSIYLDKANITLLKPQIVTFDQNNHIRYHLSYSVDLDAYGRYSFTIQNDENTGFGLFDDGMIGL
jgi:aspartate 1-decarboxylase